MIAAASEEHLARLRLGMPVRVTVQAYPDLSFPGRIHKLGEQLDPTTRTVQVTIDVPNRSRRLKPEMYATAEIEMGGSERAIFVPHEALQEVNGRTVVFVKSGDNRFEACPVTAGRSLDGSREVIAGLRAGQTVVTRGSFVVKSQMLKSTLAEE
jgi:RND family efflux transporter MFP subunit